MQNTRPESLTTWCHVLKPWFLLRGLQTSPTFDKSQTNSRPDAQILVAIFDPRAVIQHHYRYNRAFIFTQWVSHVRKQKPLSKILLATP
jgi:hypothetical protein